MFEPDDGAQACRGGTGATRRRTTGGAGGFTTTSGPSNARNARHARPCGGWLFAAVRDGGVEALERPLSLLVAETGWSARTLGMLPEIELLDPGRVDGPTAAQMDTCE